MNGYDEASLTTLSPCDNSVFILACAVQSFSDLNYLFVAFQKSAHLCFRPLISIGVSPGP